MSKVNKGPTAVNAAKTHCIRGHEFTEANTHLDHKGNRHCKACRRIQRGSLTTDRGLILSLLGIKPEEFSGKRLMSITEYSIWVDMRKRCSNPMHKSYAYYGGRGIAVCQEWDSSFENFLRSVGRRPSLLLSIDRIDNDGNYEPGNVRWATRSEQSQNRRNVKA